MPLPSSTFPLAQEGLPPPAVLAFALTASGVQRALAAPREGIGSATRGPARNAFRRQVAIYLAHVDFGLPYRMLAQAFGRDRTTVRHACALVEDRRDRPAFDAATAVLAHALLQVHGNVSRGLGASDAAAPSDVPGVLP